MVKLFFSNLLILQCLFVLPVAVSAQANPSTIKSAAIAMGNALVKKNTEQFLSYMHPSMIKMAGGKEKLSVISDSALKVFEQFGGKVSRITYGNPAEIISYKKTLQSVITQTTTLTSFIGDAELSSSLIAISNDNGKSWTFIDTNMFGIKQIKSAMPDISPALVIPKAAAPKIMMKEQ
ncbi:MAG: hypothetical protein RJB31_1801 [Bacteroidota bacterium]|jgi:hypothetical protein